MRIILLMAAIPSQLKYSLSVAPSHGQGSVFTCQNIPGISMDHGFVI